MTGQANGHGSSTGRSPRDAEARAKPTRSPPEAHARNRILLPQFHQNADGKWLPPRLLYILLIIAGAEVLEAGAEVLGPFLAAPHEVHVQMQEAQQQQQQVELHVVVAVLRQV